MLLVLLPKAWISCPEPVGVPERPLLLFFLESAFLFLPRWSLVLLAAASVGGVAPRPLLYSWRRGLSAGEEVWESGGDSAGERAAAPGGLGCSPGLSRYQQKHLLACKELNVFLEKFKVHSKIEGKAQRFPM